MANEEHLKILMEEVDRWNEWRDMNPNVEPDLSSADLSYVILINANLSSADLSDADLSYAVLVSADLSGADLSGADLSYAVLVSANLIRANLSDANLNSTDLSYADLSDANLINANLISADLTNANLRNVNFFSANLSEANLSRTQALGSSFSQAELTRSCIEDWLINSTTRLDDVVCEYIFLESQQQERRPSDPGRFFAPGDFTTLFQECLKTIDLVFSNGIDWKAFVLSLENLQVQYGEQDLSIQAIENRNDVFIIRLNVPPDADKGAIEHQAMDLYETRLAVLETSYRSDLKAKDREIGIHREKSADLKEIVKLLANRPIDVEAIATTENKSTGNYSSDLRGANIASYAKKLDGNAREQAKQYNYTVEQKQALAEAAADIQQFLEQLSQTARQQAKQYNYSAKQKQTIAEAAADIQQLLEQLSQTYPTTTQAEKLAVAAKAAEEIEANPALRSRVIGALKAGGVEALKELVDHPLITILLAALEGWQKPE